MKKKKTNTLWQILAIILAIGFTLAACNNGTSGGGDPVIPPVNPALTGTVTISGTAEVRGNLTAVTTALGGTGDINYQWKSGGQVVGENSSTYPVADTDVGKTITVTVTRAGYSGSVTSEPTAVVTDPDAPPLTGTVSISGNARVGQTLTAITTALEGTGTINYQWKRESDTGVSTVIGTNSNTYIVQTADIGSTITVTVTCTGNSSSVTSDPTAIVPDPNAPPGNAVITVTFETDAAISGPSIVDGVLTLNRSATATLTLANSGSYNADSIKWKVQDTAIRGNGVSFTLNAGNAVYKTGKLYFVTVEAERNGVPYDQTITFTVTE